MNTSSETQQVTYTAGSRKTRASAFSAYEKDFLLLDLIQETLGCSRSEAVRSALRHYAMALDLKVPE